MKRYNGHRQVASGHRPIAAITPLLIAGLALGGYASGQSAESLISASPATVAQVRVMAQKPAECTALANAAQNLKNQMAALADGHASRDQVKAAAQQLRSAFQAAVPAIKNAAPADAAAANAALQQLDMALDAEPVNLAAAKASAQQAEDAVGRILAVC